MNTPKVYLVCRTLTDEQREKVQAALSITPLSAVITTDNRDTELGRQLCGNTQGLNQPIAILAEFEHPLVAVNEDGSLTTLEI